MIRKHSLSELLAFRGEMFVDAAYRTLLGREADSAGLQHYCARMALGVDKVQIIAEIALSKEAKSLRVDLPGLPEILKRYNSRKSLWARLLFRFSEFWQIGHRKSYDLVEMQNQLDSLATELSVSNARFSKDLAVLRELSPAIERLDHRLGDVLSLHRSQYQLLELVQAKLVDGKPRLQLGAGSSKCFMNLSTSHHWKAHPVGIIRVERELAKYLSDFSNVEFVIWDQVALEFKQLKNYEVVNILSTEWTISGSEYSNHSYVENTGASFSVGDTFVSVGLDWDLNPLHQIRPVLERYQIRAIYGCYDLVPILYPEYSVNEKFEQIFKRHFIEMGHDAAKIFVDSESAKKDLRKFLSDANLAKVIPDLRVIPLAAEGRKDKLPQLASSDSGILNHVKKIGEYVIYVSSFEARKNHRLMLNIWRDLYLERGEACPQLVIVGMKGWGTSDIVQQIPRMAAYKGGKINWLQNVGDDLLLHLYANSKFAVFPSVYEGWGLAATEAMSLGKICVVSNNSAMLQSTQQLMPSYHPYDFLAWKSEISKLLDDNSYRLELEQNIKEKFKERSWKEFSKDFCEQLICSS